MRRRRFGQSTTARWVAGVLVGVLGVATIVIAVAALQRVREVPTGEQLAPVPTFTLGARSTPSSSSSPASAPTTPPDSWPRAEERFLAIGSDGWWRGVAGSCGSVAPLIEHSTDGGETWENVTPSYRGIAEIATLDPFAGSEAQTVAATGARCEVQALRTFTQGEFWEPYDDVLRAARYPDPADPASVVTPTGAIPAPCRDPRSFRAAGDIVALVCDGTAYELAPENRWSPMPVGDAVALTISDGTVLVGHTSSECDGLAVSSADGGLIGCAAGVDPAQPLAVANSDIGPLVWSVDALIPVGR